MTENKEISIWEGRECKDMYHAHFTSRAARDLLIFLKKELKQQSLNNVQGCTFWTLNLNWMDKEDRE